MVKYGAAATATTQARLDRTLAAIADPTRRRILDRLSRGPASITELALPLQISLPGLLKHVGILEEARLVETEKDGRTRQCRLGPAGMDDVASWVEDYRGRWERRLDRLEAYLAKQRAKKEIGGKNERNENDGTNETSAANRKSETNGKSEKNEKSEKGGRR